VRAVAACCVALLACSFDGSAEARRPRVVRARGPRPIVAVSPFRGPQGRFPEATVMRALRPRAVVLSSGRFAIVAKGLFAESQAPEDLAAVARELGAQWVVTGQIKAEGARWALTVSLRDADDGQARAKLRYPLPSPRCPPAVLRTLSREILDALAAARSAKRRAPSKPSIPPPEAPPSEAPEGDTPPVAPPTTRNQTRPQVGDDDEAPPTRPGENSRRSARVEPPPPEAQPKAPAPEPDPEPPPSADPPPKKPQPPAPISTGRPRWARWFELSIAGSVSGRAFSVDPPPPKFSSSVVAGIRADFTLYPLAFTWKNAYGLFAGLGLGITLDKPFWPDSTSKADPTQRFPTSELRVEGGLRYKITLYKPMPRPQLTLLAEGGLHDFSFAKGPGGEDVVGVPDVRYVYAAIGAGLTIHFAEWTWLWVRFGYLAITDTGPIQARDQYGLSAAYGLRFSGGLDFLVYKGLRLGALGFYERYKIVFGYDPNNRAKVADGATDEYYGGMLLLGYVL
jgi:TolB-like protein